MSVLKILSFAIIFLLIGVSGYLISIAPYHMYSLSITEGLRTSFLTFSKPNVHILKGVPFQLDSDDLIEYEDSSAWKKFHFQHFMVSLPVRHPNYIFLPQIHRTHLGVKIGGKFVNSDFKEIASFETFEVGKINLNIGPEQLFQLPYFKKYITQKSIEEKWIDLFQKDLSLKDLFGEKKKFHSFFHGTDFQINHDALDLSVFQQLNELKHVSYQELVYNLFLLNNRQNFLDQKVKKLFFDSQKQMGVMELEAPDSTWKVERFYFYKEGKLYSFLLKIKKNLRQAHNLRFKIIQDLEVKHSNKDSAITIAADFKNLDYKNRTDPEGMTYLISAWSHDVENSDFFKVAIMYLERGENNSKFLQPLYDYAFKRFGSNFSTLNELVKDSDEIRMEKEKNKLIDERIQNEALKRSPSEFSKTPEDEINTVLKNAKEKKINSDASRPEIDQW